MLLRTSLALLLSATAVSPLPSTLPANAAEGVAVVELFTSEGCSSCPPADALLRRIHGMHVESGQLVIGISEHVTYWNHLGWKDPFSSQTFTDRQQRYASRLTGGESYTPQIVVNGSQQLVGSDVPSLQRALQRDARRPHSDLRILEVRQQSGAMQIRFAFSQNGSTEAVDVVAVITDDADRSSVMRGENAGRELTHISVARLLSKVATARGSGEQTVNLALPAELHVAGHSGHHLVLFAQQQQQGEILAAATREL